MTSGESNFNGL